MQISRIKQHSAKLLGVGNDRIWIDPKQLDRVAEAITKDDIRSLISENIIKKRKLSFKSRTGARKLLSKKAKGRKRGKGKKKGTKKTRSEIKKTWISKIRAQRRTLKELNESSPKAVQKIGYSNLYKKVKGNHFKGKNYLKRFVEGKVEGK